jgi:hypothetical protein
MPSTSKKPSFSEIQNCEEIPLELRLKLSQVKKTEAKVGRLLKEIKELRHSISSTCNHSVTYPTTDWSGGNYLNRGYMIYKTFCAVCDKMISENHETGGFA